MSVTTCGVQSRGRTSVRYGRGRGSTPCGWPEERTANVKVHARTTMRGERMRGERHVRRRAENRYVKKSREIAMPHPAVRPMSSWRAQLILRDNNRDITARREGRSRHHRPTPCEQQGLRGRAERPAWRGQSARLPTIRACRSGPTAIACLDLRYRPGNELLSRYCPEASTGTVHFCSTADVSVHHLDVMPCATSLPLRPSLTTSPWDGLLQS